MAPTMRLLFEFPHETGLIWRFAGNVGNPLHPGQIHLHLIHQHRDVWRGGGGWGGDGGRAPRGEAEGGRSLLTTPSPRSYGSGTPSSSQTPALPPAVWPEAHNSSEPPSQYLENEIGSVTPKTSPPLSETPVPSGELTDPEVLLSIALAGFRRQTLPQLAHVLFQAVLAQNGCPEVPRLDDADFHPEVVELTPGKEELGLSLGPHDDQGSSE